MTARHLGLLLLLLLYKAAPTRRPIVDPKKRGYDKTVLFALSRAQGVLISVCLSSFSAQFQLLKFFLSHLPLNSQIILFIWTDGS